MPTNYPSAWSKVFLGELISTIRNGTTAQQMDYAIPFPVTRIETISEGLINFSRVKYLARPEPAYLLKKNDILYSHINSIKHMGKVALYDGMFPLYHGMNLMLLRPNEGKVHPKFLFVYLSSEFGRAHTRKECKSAINQASLGQGDIKNLKIHLPPISEQRRIAEILDTIDEAIQKTESLISKLKSMKQGLLHDLLTCGLDKNGKLRDSKDHLISFSDVVQVNPKTELYGLNDTTNVSFIPMSDVSESGQWVIRQIRSLKDVRNGYTCFKENDILFAKITSCMENGKGGHAIGLVNGIGFGTTEFHILRVGAEIEPRYIYYWTMTEELRRKAEAQMAGSAGQRRVPSEFFDNFKIPLFPRSEQRKIVEILNAHDVLTRTEKQYRDKLKLQKKGLMHDLLTGKVRIRL